MGKNRVRSVWALLLTVLLMVCLGLPVKADEPADRDVKRKIDITLLGDSYSAGNGAGEYEPSEPGYYRSHNNWANRYQEWLFGQNVSTTLHNLAMSGATTDRIIEEQVSKIPQNTDLVMLSIGGNDGGFGAVVEKCFAVGMRDAVECRQCVESFRSFVRSEGSDGLTYKTTQVFKAIGSALPGVRAEIVLMGYPHLVTPGGEGYVLHGCEKVVFYSCASTLNYPAGAEIRKLADELAVKQQSIVRAWNATLSHRAHFVSSVREDFRDHEPDPSALTKNPNRWINEFFESEGDTRQREGRGEPVVWIFQLSFDPHNWYHPNIIGHLKMAEALIKTMSVPRTAQRVFSLPEDGDGARPNDILHDKVSAGIRGPYAQMIGKPLELDARPSWTNVGDPAKYEWDFNGDGVFDEQTANPVVNHTWSSEFVGDIHLRVTSAHGDTAETSTYAMITNDGDSTPYDQDNCPTVNNHGQTDYDGDGVGDECDDTPGYPTEDRPGVGEGPAPSSSPAPSPTPSSQPSATSTPTPSVSPSTSRPTSSPSAAPSSPNPSPSPSLSPTSEPQPSISPTVSPSADPVPTPSLSPSATPSMSGSTVPSTSPAAEPMPTVPDPSQSRTGLPSPTDPQLPTSPGPRSKPGLPKTGG